MASILRYPYEALLDTTDYLRVDLLSYDAVRSTGPGNLIRNSVAFDTTVTQPKKAKTLSGSIILPMPSNVQDGNSVSYADSSLDGLTAQVYGVVNDNITGGGRNGTLGSVADALSNTLKGLADVTVLNPDAQKIFTKSIAAQAANIPFGGNLTLSQILARESGQILNPNMELLFNGVTLRSFKFSFKMTPRNPDEAQQIRAIIKTFKLNMAPKAQSDVFLKTPNLFQLSYRKGPDLHPYLNLFKQCFLTDMSVNYTGEGVYSTYSDGSPISYTMDLGFKELEPIYEGDYASNITPANSVGF
jgi:hypothetical protein